MMIILLLLCYGVFLETILYQDKETRLLAIGVPIGRGFGVVTNFTMIFVLLFMARLPLTWLSNTPFSLILPLEVSFDLHKVFAYITFFAGTIHGVLQTVNFATNPNENQTWNALAERVVFGGRSTFVSGWILYGIFVFMLITFFKPVKSCFGYQGFLNTHRLWVIYLILLFFHGNEKGLPVYWKWGIVPTVILCLHYAIQHFSEKKTKSIVVVDKCSLDKKAKVIRLEILRQNFKFKAGQYAFVSVDELGKEKHPLTIASAPCEDTVTFFIKVAGDWTENLYNLIEARKKFPAIGPLQCTMRGGFGAPTEFAYQFEDVVLVGTGVGATPFIALMKDIIWSNSVKSFLENEASLLSPDAEKGKKDVAKFKSDLKQIETIKLLTKPKKVFFLKKNPVFNSFTYGVFWQQVISIFLLLTYVDSAPFNPDQLNSLGVPVTELPVDETEGRFRIIYDFFWYFFGIVIMIGYVVDVIYRLQVESHTMHKRQMVEIFLHVVFWMWLVVTWLIRIITNDVLDWRFALPLMILNGCSNIGWFLYIARIAGLRITPSSTKIERSTKSLRFVYIDRSFDAADWIVEEILNLQRLAEEKLGMVECIIDVYFTRDQGPPQSKTWSDSNIINTYIGRPDWDLVVNTIITHHERKLGDSEGSDIELHLKDLELADSSFVETHGYDRKRQIGLFFCGSPIVGDALQKAAAKYSSARKYNIVWHKEAFG